MAMTMRRVSRACVIAFLLAAASAFAVEPLAKMVSGVRFENVAFDPAGGERARLRYDLSENATVTVKVFDPDGGLVAVPVTGAAQKAGAQEVVWDGRDLDGKVVP